jgi:hypothetical protein
VQSPGASDVRSSYRLTRGHPRRRCPGRGLRLVVLVRGRVQDAAEPGDRLCIADLPGAQTQSPTAAYKGGPGGTTNDELTFLAYYTANGNKKFCDSKPANAEDKQWAALYVNLDSQAAAKNVKGITG